jgi:hypothetical protein
MSGESERMCGIQTVWSNLVYASIPMVAQVNTFITEEYYILGCTAVQSGKSLWTFREKIVSPSLGSKRKPSKQKSNNTQINIFHVVLDHELSILNIFKNYNF